MKILIEINGGAVTSVKTDEQCDYIIMDHDQEKVGENLYSPIMESELLTNDEKALWME